MKLFDKLRIRSASERLMEEQLYQVVVDELRQGQKREGLWAKAIARSDGSEDKAKSLYLKYRVQSIIDENKVAQVLAEDAIAKEEEQRMIEKEKIESDEKAEIAKEKHRIKLLKKALRQGGGKYIEDK
ncbi:MAG: hypothetical protein V7744_08870 [Pseudomonadales bacterium]